MIASQRVLVLDYGSQFNLLITRRLRECGVYAELVAPVQLTAELRRDPPVVAVILSGGPSSVNDEGAPQLPDGLLESGLPILGICYGMQLLARALGGQVVLGARREYGRSRVRIHHAHSLWEGMELEQECWMSHGDQIHKLPPGFTSLASTDSALAAMGDDHKKIYGLQFHPEVSHTPHGLTILRNFLRLAGCRFDWTSSHFITQAIEQIRLAVGSERVACALSGGVDSTVAAVLVQRAVGDQLSCLFVDHGLLRYREAEEVVEIYKSLSLPVQVLDSCQRFFTALDGVTDPEIKRKRIGETFVRVFESAIDQLGEPVTYLVQGTLYPDIVESGGAGASKTSANIKTHHNVGGLPEDMTLKLIEPLRALFKDEVRRVGAELGIPAAILMRQPFPGPGLAVRILGAVSQERVHRLQLADAIVREELDRLPLSGHDTDSAGRPWQYFAVLLPVRTVGTMGDGRTYAEVIALRAVHSEDAMTAHIARLDWDLLERVAGRIVNEVEGVNRVVYDLTSKPPGTIEWE